MSVWGLCLPNTNRRPQNVNKSWNLPDNNAWSQSKQGWSSRGAIWSGLCFFQVPCDPWWRRSSQRSQTMTTAAQRTGPPLKPIPPIVTLGQSFQGELYNCTPLPLPRSDLWHTTIDNTDPFRWQLTGHSMNCDSTSHTESEQSVCERPNDLVPLPSVRLSLDSESDSSDGSHRPSRDPAPPPQKHSSSNNKVRLRFVPPLSNLLAKLKELISEWWHEFGLSQLVR